MASHAELIWQCSLPMQANSHSIGSSTAVVSTADLSGPPDEFKSVELGVDLERGERIWEFESETDLNAPFVFTEPEIATEGVVVFTETFGGRMFVLDIRRGEVLWEHQVTNNWLMKLLNKRLLARNIVTNVEYGKGSLYVTVGSNRFISDDYSTVLAFDVDTGKKTGEFSLDGFGGGMRYFNGCLYLRTLEDFKAYDTNGELQYLKRHALSGGQGMTVHDGVLYEASRNSVWARSLADGSILWELRNEFSTVTHSHGIGVTDDVLCITETADSGVSRLYAIDTETGTITWKKEITAEGTHVSAPTIGDSTVYTVAGDGKMYAHDSASGEQRWQLTFAERAGGSPLQPWISETGLVFALGDQYYCVTSEELSEVDSTAPVKDEKSNVAAKRVVDLAVIPNETTVDVGEPIAFEIRSENGLRVQGATVSAAGKTTITDSRGQANLVFDAPGEYTVEVYKNESNEDYGTDSVTITVR